METRKKRCNGHDDGAARGRIKQNQRVLLMDRSVPIEEVLSETQQSVQPIYYLVRNPRGRRLIELEADSLERP